MPPSSTVFTPTLAGRRIQVAGSVNPATDARLAKYAHSVVASIAKSVLEAGGSLILGAGKDPRPEGGPPDHPGILFDWTALEVVRRVDTATASSGSAAVQYATVVISGKGAGEIPAGRMALWNELVSRHAIRVEWIQAGARSGAMIRDRQAEFGNALVLLGGGTGVEHLAHLYMDRRRPVIPLDLKLGASRNDGMGGAERLAMDARASPQRFLTLAAGSGLHVGTIFASLACQDGNAPAAQVAERVVHALGNAAPPVAFFVRLLNTAHVDYPQVESYFRNVVDHVVAEQGLQRMELGTDPSSRGLMNVQLFEDLHDASVAVVDVTGERPNCFLELGYALGRSTRVIATARRGTTLPWDQQAVPCHFWDPVLPDKDRRDALATFWRLNMDRPPIVLRRS